MTDYGAVRAMCRFTPSCMSFNWLEMINASDDPTALTVSMIKCSNVYVFKCQNFKMLKRSNVPMCNERLNAVEMMDASDDPTVASNGVTHTHHRSYSKNRTNCTDLQIAQISQLSHVYTGSNV